ncbi:MAG: DUF2065 domain-containing protein [Cyanobacteria bacterium J06649_5]
MDWLEDVLQAPIKTLLVVAGIAFIAASILGQLGLPWIALPRKWQRMMAGMFGTVLLIVGVALEGFPEGSVPSTAAPNPPDTVSPPISSPTPPSEDTSNASPVDAPQNPPVVQPPESNKISSEKFLLEKATFAPGETIRVEFTAEEDYASQAWIGLISSSVSHGSETINDQHDKAYKYIQNRLSGTEEFRAPEEPGSYDFRMNNEGVEVDFITFEVTFPDPKDLENGQLTLEKATFAPGETIRVKFTAEEDYVSQAWIGLIPSGVRHGSETINDQHDKAYKYIQNRLSGTEEFKAPEEPGPYDFRMNNEGAEVSFISFEVQ